ncbi:5-(carboxyamino)imidazole ribonucleotide synthase [Limimonas halophila]|uniref:N5-carboxyaminoimidazole ribonucleotide synthase n=1 Tax=Limimonas halophila TaxID=1082479 RepID=A0A1G7LQI2_9PROT|nr:5-(carboxyamino)imidazole ribonucleotide synthase [Limimonas halophila]SDF51772.1 5-(carboxyamino)imidazole ribonucleotide synthase [Limimonas halophila]
MSSDPLPPGSTIGILGGGQLGRMSAMAAAQLGYRVHVYAPQADSPASHVAPRTTVAPYDDAGALTSFAADVDVVTCEFENVPAATAETLENQGALLRPRPGILAACQHRRREKDTLHELGVPTAPYAAVHGADDLISALDAIGRPAVLKAARMGYDGKGQVAIEAGTDTAAAWEAMSGTAPEPEGVLEGMVDFALEVSVVVARGVDGTTAAYVPVENRHPGHVLARTVAPAPVGPAVAERADAIARRIAVGLDLVGVMGVEMFVTKDGEVLVNELAPRPHNSGHWTLDACPASQFEQHVRAVTGLPLAPAQRHSDAVMDNLLGHDADRWREIVHEPNARLHLYGKAEVRPGRKMGHVTRLAPKGAHGGEL